MKRWIIIGGLAAALALAGCSKSDETSSTPTTNASASSDDGDTPTTEAGGSTKTTLSLEDCLGVATANLGLVSGNEADAEKLKSYDPPDEVKEAADLLVAKGGIQLSGDNQEETIAAADTLTAWADDVCPG